MKLTRADKKILNYLANSTDKQLMAVDVNVDGANKTHEAIVNAIQGLFDRGEISIDDVENDLVFWWLANYIKKTQ